MCFVQVFQIMPFAGFETPHSWLEVKPSYRSATPATRSTVPVVVLCTICRCTTDPGVKHLYVYLQI